MDKCAPGKNAFPLNLHAFLPSFTTWIKVSSHTLHTLPQSFNLFKASLVLNRQSCIENNLATQLSIVFRFDHFGFPTFWLFYVCIDGSRSVPVFIFPLRKLRTFALFESPTLLWGTYLLYEKLFTLSLYKVLTKLCLYEPSLFWTQHKTGYRMATPKSTPC